jgi:hypothetical protein
MYYVMTERENLVAFLPHGGVGAEVGVAQGDFAAVLLERARPSRLHLIDPWSYREDSKGSERQLLNEVAGKSGPFAPPATNEVAEEHYRAICDRFADRNDVTLHRQFSYKAAREFSDRYFDFVYLDGNHEYEHVLQDLCDFAPKIKEDGLLLGHDFFEDKFAKENHYGVIDAVKRFLQRFKEFRILCLTYDTFSSFVLFRTYSGFSRQFQVNLLESQIPFFELADDQAFRYEHKYYVRRDGSTRRVASFVA